MIMGTSLSWASSVKETRKVNSFSKISVSSGIDVYFTQSNTYKVEVEADSENIGKIITQTKGDVLVIKREEGSKWNKRKGVSLKVYVSAPDLYEISASGGSDFYSDEIKCGKSFNIDISGGSDIDIKKLIVSNLTDIDASGGSDCNINMLQTKDCNIDISGGSDIDINIDAKGKVNVGASGGSDLKLSGKVKHIDISCSGGSDADIRNLTYDTIESSKSGSSDIYK